jgi:hypothetical protein
MGKMPNQMIYQRHGRIPVCCILFNLQDLHFFPTYLWPSLYTCWANLIFEAALNQVIFVLLNAYSKGLLVLPM